MAASSDDGWRTASFECLDNHMAFPYLCCSHGQSDDDPRDVEQLADGTIITRALVFALLVAIAFGLIMRIKAMGRTNQQEKRP